MSEQHTREQVTGFKLWMQAARPFSFPASVVPVLVGTMAAVYLFDGAIMWFLLPLIALGGILIHAGGNMISDYFDFKQGVDREDTYGSSKTVVHGLITPKKILTGGLTAFAIAFLLGLVMIYFRGLPVLYLGLTGLAGGYFYTAKPFELKYNALGDFIIFLIFGPLMVIGTYYTLTGNFNPKVIWIAIPVGFLVTAILNANNLRDIMHDSRARIKTLATVFGSKGAKFEYYFLVIGAFISVILMVAAGLLEFWALIVFISLPLALTNIKAISKAEVDKPSDIAILDVKTAQHHLMFGVLLSIGVLLSALI